MRPESLYFLFSPVTRIKGVGGATAGALTRLLPSSTVIAGSTAPVIRDLLFHLPVDIVDRRFTCPLHSAPEEVVATFVVTVDEHIPPPPSRRGKTPYKVLCSNETGDITLVFFNAHADYIKQSLPVGSRRVISGRCERFDYRLQMPHPDIIAPADKLAEVQKVEPVYPLTAGITSRRIAAIVNDALEKLPELPEWIGQFPLPLREGCRGWGYTHSYAEASIDRAKQLRNEPTEAEKKLWHYLRKSQADNFKFRRQQPIGPYIADFFSSQAKLVIELDGGQHADQQEYDAKRTSFLEAQGYRVLRFWNNDVLTNIEGVYQAIVDALKTPPPNPLPQEEGESTLPSWKQALHHAHHPQSPEDISPDSPARLRLAYDEILANQLHLAILRRNMQRQAGAVIEGDGSLTDALLKTLPFALTDGQRQALGEIYADMASGHRMGRLLQGDVGSGKTIVALLAMLRVAEQGMQSALMVPTEIIAQQHFEVITSLLATRHSPLTTTVLLTGNVKGKQREEALAHIASGKAQIVIGTHALFQEHVEFKNLALVVIDEQHRFGVNQRMALSAKGDAPHLLHMTATPIPRSLTMTLYGDMECSVLKEKPAGRKPVATRVVPLSRYEEVVTRLKAALDRGEKAYWICPLIEDDQIPPFGGDNDLAAAKTRFAEFKARFGPVVGLVHGRMRPEERNAAMQAFAEGKTQLLVATTVVEVGVDVRDATIMVIEQAERFGLSQLHQLRGRVGRGDKPSACVLLYSPFPLEGEGGVGGKAQTPMLKVTPPPNPLPQGEGGLALQRLSILRETEDGFRIAEEDLKIRGGGDLLGVRQSGMPRFIFTDLFRHQELIRLAREDVRQFLAADPPLSSPRGQALTLLLQLFGFELPTHSNSDRSSASSGASPFSTAGTA